MADSENRDPFGTQERAPAAAVTAAPPLSRIEATIDAWFARHFHNSPVSRDSELYNHVHAAKEDLKLLLLAQQEH